MEKIRSEIKLTSKIMEMVEIMSRKKKNDRKYPSKTRVLKIISMMKMAITARLRVSNTGSTV